MPGLFEAGSELAERFGPRLAELLDEEETALASATTPNAHYTSPMVAEAVWRLARKLGFENGAAIEPGCGPGVFMATAPDGARITGVEKDPTTAAICRAAHPGHTVITADLADVARPGSFELAVGNVPFSGIVKPYDPVISADRGLNLHNYSLAKALWTPSGPVWVISIFLLAHAACNSLGAGRSEVPHTETMASPWVASVPANPMAQPPSGE